MRILLRLVGFVLVILVVLVAALLLLPADRVARLAADQVEAQTGRALELSGDVSMSFWPVLGVSTGPVRFANAPWAGDAPMFEAESLEIGVNAAALWGGDVEITRLRAVGPTLRLETRADGQANWMIETASATGNADADAGTAAGGNTGSLLVQEMSLREATVIYDAHDQAPVELSGVDLDLTWAEASAPADLQASFEAPGGAVSLTATIAQFGAWLNGAAQAVRADVTAPGGTVSFAGAAGIAGELSGDITLNTPDTGAFLRALGAGAVELPEGLGQRIEARGKVTLTQAGQLALRDAVLDLDGNAFQGAADVTLDDVPQVNAQFTAGALDFRGVSGGAPGQEEAETSSGWSQAPLDASGLAAFNGAVSLVAESIDLGSMKLGASRVLMRLERSRAVFELREVRAFGGLITGDFVTNNRSGLSVGGRLRADGIEMEEMLSDMAGVTQISGKADATIEFLGVGQSVDAIMRSLSGQASVNAGQGRFLGFDLDQLLRTGDGRGGTTVFDSLTATAQIADGSLRNEDLLVLLRNFRAEGAGRIGLGAQDMDYRFTPVALRVNEGAGGLAIPVRIRGAWSDLRIQPDLEEAINLNLAQEREALENRVEEEVREQLEQELGVVTEEGQSIEDAVKDRLEEEIGDRLRGLFD